MSKRMNKERVKEKLLEKFKEHCYPVTQKDNSIEEGMTLTGITQVIDEVFSTIESLDNEWVDVRDRLPEQPYDEVMCRPALRTKPMLVSVNGDDWLKDKLYGTKNATYNQVILAYYSFRDNCWKDSQNKTIVRDSGIHSREVIAWKPLPQPYERKE